MPLIREIPMQAHGLSHVNILTGGSVTAHVLGAWNSNGGKGETKVLWEEQRTVRSVKGVCPPGGLQYFQLGFPF